MDPDLAGVNVQFAIYAGYMNGTPDPCDEDECRSILGQWCHFIRQKKQRHPLGAWNRVSLQKLPHLRWPLDIYTHRDTDGIDEVSRNFHRFELQVKSTNKYLESLPCSTDLASTHQIRVMIQTLTNVSESLPDLLVFIWNDVCRVEPTDAIIACMKSLAHEFKVTVSRLNSLQHTCRTEQQTAHGRCDSIKITMPDLSHIMMFPKPSSHNVDTLDVAGLCRTGDRENYVKMLRDEINVDITIHQLVDMSVKCIQTTQKFLKLVKSDSSDAIAVVQSPTVVLGRLKQMQEWVHEVLLPVFIPPQIYSRVPQCEIVVVPTWLEAVCDSALYMRPTMDLGPTELDQIEKHEPVMATLTNNGTVFVSTSMSTSSTCDDLLPIVLHECSPGHHLQMWTTSSGLFADGRVPLFKQFMLDAQSTMCEGWGLYSESLWIGVLMLCAHGIIQDARAIPDCIGGIIPRARSYLKCVVTDQLLRSARPLFDVGIHCAGWTNLQAVEIMSQVVPLTPTQTLSQYSRYVSLPTQATAYKLGELHIRWCLRKLHTTWKNHTPAVSRQKVVMTFHEAVLIPCVPSLGGLALRIASVIKTNCPDLGVIQELESLCSSSDGRTKCIMEAAEFEESRLRNMVESTQKLMGTNKRFTTIADALNDELACNVIFSV